MYAFHASIDIEAIFGLTLSALAVVARAIDAAKSAPSAPFGRSQKDYYEKYHTLRRDEMLMRVAHRA